MSDLKTTTVTGVFWVMIERLGIQVINFIISTILARLLMPNDFGTVGIVMVFVSIAQVVMEGGLANSLIRTKNPKPVDYSVVFLGNLLISVLVYLILFFSAPGLAVFFKIPIFTKLLRVIGFIIVIRSFAIIQVTKLVMEFKFKKHLTIQIPSILAGGLTGVIMALNNYGVWSIVGSQLTTAFFLTIQLWIRSSWKPELVFDSKIFKKHFFYGSNHMGAQMMKMLFQNSFNFVIAKVYTPVQLGLYSRANALKQIPVETFANALSNVTLPVFSRLQDEKDKLYQAYIKVSQQIFYILAPLFCFLIVMAEPLFRFLFTDKWVPAVPYFQLLCIEGMIQPFVFYNSNVLDARGKAALLFRLELIKRIVLGLCIFIVYRYGMYPLIYLEMSYFFLSFLLNELIVGNELRKNMLGQLKSMLVILIFAFIAAFITWSVDQLSIIKLDFFRLFLGGILFIVLYIFLTLLFKISAARELVKLFSEFVNRIRSKDLSNQM